VRIPFVRTYTSRFSIHPSPDQAFGRNCTHRFDIAPVGSRNPYRDLYLVLPDGDFVHFDRMSKGTGYADAVYRHTETSSRFYGSLTRWNGNGWDVFLRDGSLIRFPESYHARNMAQGAATEIVDARSNRIDLERDGQRNLKEIRIAGGRWLRLTHDADGRIVRADDDGGRWTTYDYAGGLLTRVRHSDGTGQDYVYRGDLLTVVRDQHGRDVIRNDYRDSMLLSQEIAGGKRYRFHYTMAPNRAYAVEATVETDDGRIRSIPTAASVSPTLVALRPDDPR
jgi:YD repeat-containing protein